MLPEKRVLIFLFSVITPKWNRLACAVCAWWKLVYPQRDRVTGELVKNEDGTTKISFAPKLETGCTTPVVEGMEVRTTTEKSNEGRKAILEFILTSHPLDCPICDKGGECALQDLTMLHGPGKSRFIYDDKKLFAKHVPLGEMILLDRERCIQCGLCVRFQHEVVDDPVLLFLPTWSLPGDSHLFRTWI